MAVDPRPLNRATLARICQGDQEAVRLLERLFVVGGQLTPESLVALTEIVDAQGTEISALDGRVTVAEVDIAALDSRVTGAEADVAALDGRVTVAEGDIAALDGMVAAAEVDIVALNVAVAGKADAAAGVPVGGTAGQYLRKQSGADYDDAWAGIVAADVSDLGDMALQSAVAVAIAGGSADNVALTNCAFTSGLIAGVPVDATTLTTSDVSYFFQPAPAVKAAAATLTVAELLTGIIRYTGGVAANLTMPTGANIDAGILPGLPVDTAFEFTIIKTGAATVTLVVNTGVTAFGSMAVATNTSGRFAVRKTAADTFAVYRL